LAAAVAFFVRSGFSRELLLDDRYLEELAAKAAPTNSRSYKSKVKPPEAQA
jgi:hypothetical protein